MSRSEPDGFGWAFIPLLTCGFGTGPAFLHVAMRRGSIPLGVIAAGYGLASAGVFAAMAEGLGAIAVLLLMITWIVGSLHAFAVRPKLFPRRTPRDRLNQHAIDVARYRRELRTNARRLVADDPGLAHDLGIGRPDLPRAYDDGGLIDVNHAPPQVLGMLPGMTDELVSRIMELRSQQGTFISAEELAVHADLPPHVVPGLAEYGVFLP